MTETRIERGAVVTLTDAELRVANFVGVERNAMALARGARNHVKGTTADDIKSHVDGFAAELAFCRLCNIYPELSFNAIRGGDCHIGPWAIDVKARRAGKWRDLLIWNRSAVDWYALMILDLPRVHFEGAYRAADVTADHRVDLGYGPCHRVPNAQLTPLRYVLTDEQVEAFVRAAVKVEEIRWD